MKTIAIIPAFNESERLQGVIDKTLLHVDHIVVVDDGSTIALNELMPNKDQVTFLRHIINLGKGAAMKTGVIWAKQQGYETAVFIDADGQHDPNEIPALLKPITDQRADIAFGVRKFHGHMPMVARFGNLVLTRALQFLYNIRVQDTQSGFRALRLSEIDKIMWMSPRYSVETEMIVNAGKHKVPFEQIPIRTIYHDKYKGTTIIDGIRIMINLVAWKIL